MGDDILNSITTIWNGHMIPFPEVQELESTHLYVSQGVETRAIIIVYEFDEDWIKTTDVMIPDYQVTQMYVLENLFKAPSILAVAYRDRQVWMKVGALYFLACKNSGAKHQDLTHDGNVFIPKEQFKHLIKR